MRYPETGDQSIPFKKDYEGAVQAHEKAELLFEEDIAIWSNADLAVIFLSEDVEGIAPVSLTRAEVRERDPIMLVGYGVSDRNNLQRWVGENEVSGLREQVPGNVEIVAKRDRLEDGGAASHLIIGDSGGSCFKVDGPSIVLVGVSAATQKDIWDRRSSFFTSVFAYKDWLEKRMNDRRARRDPP